MELGFGISIQAFGVKIELAVAPFDWMLGSKTAAGISWYAFGPIRVVHTDYRQMQEHR